MRAISVDGSLFFGTLSQVEYTYELCNYKGVGTGTLIRNTEGLSSSAFYDLCPSSGSGIWAASRNNIILYKQQHIEVFDFTSLIKGSWITSITEDRFGRLWVGTSSGSLFYLVK